MRRLAIPLRLVDTIRDGKAPASIRRKGAEGSLPVSLPEKIEILAVLARDGEEEIRAKAIQTFSNWNAEELHQILSDPQTTTGVLLECAKHLLPPERKEFLAFLPQNHDLTDALRDEGSAPLNTGPETGCEASPPAPPEPPARNAAVAVVAEKLTLLQKVSRMTPSQKVRAALTGNQEARMILIRDPNKYVARAVLMSPKLSDVEIETYAAMKDISEEVLRVISLSRHYMKIYTVMRALINNPRAPVDSTLPFVNRLNDKDLRFLGKNRNVPEAVRFTALKIIRQKAEAARKNFTRRDA